MLALDKVRDPPELKGGRLTEVLLGKEGPVWQDLASDQLTALDAPKAPPRADATLGARERDFFRFGVRKPLFSNDFPSKPPKFFRRCAPSAPYVR